MYVLGLPALSLCLERPKLQTSEFRVRKDLWIEKAPAKKFRNIISIPSLLDGPLQGIHRCGKMMARQVLIGGQPFLVKGHL